MIDLIKESPFYQEIQKDAAERLVSRQLTKRFGELDEETKSQIKGLSKEQTENLAVTIFDFNSLDDVRVWLSRTELGLEK